VCALSHPNFRGASCGGEQDAATYEDRVADYVTSEPAIDYAASSTLLLAALS
jgi:hypothetical protein